MKKKRILVTGAHGQLGQSIRKLSESFESIDFIFAGRDQFPLHQPEELPKRLASLHPDFCINCAAYTNVDRAESEPELARLVNATAVAVLAAACREQGTRFVHISTDYVFDGLAVRPYKETDPTNPINIYGVTKREGEQNALSENSDSIILRSSWVYAEHGRNFVQTMVRLMQTNPVVKVVSDQHGSPTYARDLGAAILEIIRGDTWLPGIYHYSNAGEITWYEFAVAIRDICGFPCNVEPIASDAYPTAARRPAYSILDKSSFKSTFNIDMKPWKQSLSDCLSARQVV